MGGVDVHDQLRLQRYSTQLSMKFKKYYKSLFLGIFDMVLVNMFIVHKWIKKENGEKAPVHHDFLNLLHKQLLQITPDEMLDTEEDSPCSMPTSNGNRSANTHSLQETNEFRTSNGFNKRRQRSCKVCSILRKDKNKKAFSSKFYCEECSQGEAKVYLCDRVRRMNEGNRHTCFEIWHSVWKNGVALPPNVKRTIHMRGPNRKRIREDN
jgi:hypothetical protein